MAVAAAGNGHAEMEKTPMKSQMDYVSRAAVAASIMALAMLVAGCSGKKDDGATFATPEEAAAALVAALQSDDKAEMSNLLGPGTDELLSSGDPVADKADRAQFLASYQAQHSLVPEGDDKMIIVTGPDDWPMPIPIVKRERRWVFDGAAGADEIIYRRVGANELGAIEVCRGYVAAQLDYAAEGHDGDPAGIYALKLLSDPGLHNGLYWETAADEPASPGGAFVASAAAEGYAAQDVRTPYHGYYYRMLYAQGPNASGGARDYFKDGVLTEGFALIAWPADYGSSGVQTFLVNHEGGVFQKDLGEETAAAADAIKTFDPDSSWISVDALAPVDAAAAAL
jgi:hypothetical protein